MEASKLSFCPEYGSKHKEEYVLVRHLPKFPSNDDSRMCSACHLFSCCNDNWQQVWAVLKPGFLALLKDPFDKEPLDIIVFDVLPSSNANGENGVSLALEINEHNPLRHAFEASLINCLNLSKLLFYPSVPFTSCFLLHLTQHLKENMYTYPS